MIYYDANNWTAPNRKIKAKVVFSRRLTPEEEQEMEMVGYIDVATYTEQDSLKAVTINRECEQGKLFGFGIFQKTTITLIDKERTINEEELKKCEIDISFCTDKSFTKSTPTFFVKEMTRNENTNELTITGYDALERASNYTYADLRLQIPYAISDVFAQIVEKLFPNGNSLFGDWVYNYDNFEAFSTLYNNGANYDATTTLKTIMDDIAAATQTVYFLQSNNEVYFKSLVEVTEPVLTISKNEYYTFETQKPIALQGIAHITELGENVSAGTVPIQYVRNNGFWEYHEDIGQAVETALSYIEGFELMPYNLTWRGNCALEIGDMVNIVAKDNSVVKAFILSDTITYTGGLKQTSSWSYTEPEPQATNPSNLGEAIKQTVARVDKVKQEIELVVNETAQLKIDTKGITASVAELDAKVEAKATPEELKIEVQKGLAEGVNKVTTTTGFTFNDNGLRITKTNSEIETLITEDGMKIYKGSNEVLTADNEGVKATDLHATTYLIIGDNSRLENYSGGRTACFWIG